MPDEKSSYRDELKKFKKANKKRYNQITKKFERPGPSQAELKAAYEAGDDYVGKDDKGNYYLD